MKLGNATLAAALFASAVLCSAVASATTITFSGLSGANGTPVASYSESGFTFTTTTGQFFEGQVFGNPAPSLGVGSIFGGPALNQLTITDSGSFNFDQFDLATNNGATGYSLAGFLGGVQQYSFSAVEPEHTAIFNTILNPDAAIAVDEVLITLNVSGTSANIDNVVLNVAAVSEPASLALLCSALAGMRIWRRRKTARSEAC
jgi:hypothetical protein